MVPILEYAEENDGGLDLVVSDRLITQGKAKTRSVKIQSKNALH